MGLGVGMARALPGEMAVTGRGLLWQKRRPSACSHARWRAGAAASLPPSGHTSVYTLSHVQGPPQREDSRGM